MSNTLRDRVCIITGGSNGLGKAIALQLASEGAAGIAICGRNAGNGAGTVKELQALDCNAIFIQADLKNISDCRMVVKEAEDKFNIISGLVNCAADTSRGTIEDTSEELWDNILAVNLKAPYFLTQEVVKSMKRNSVPGSIVNIGSVSGWAGQPYISAYCISKGAMITFTKNTAHALRKDKIRVNQVNPGWMSTPAEHAIQIKSGEPDNWLENADADAPFGRILRTTDISSMVCHLLSDKASLMTGAVIDFDQNVVGAYD